MARIFAAIRLPAEVEAHLDEHVDGVRTSQPDLRWVPPSRWHLTLEFMGECGPHEVSRQLQRWARRAARVEALRLALTGVGSFPKPWTAKVLWIGLGGDVERWRALAAYGQEPHVTVARVRERRDLTGVLAELESYAGPAWTVDEITVFRSHLRGSTDHGPRYEPLEAFPLGRAG